MTSSSLAVTADFTGGNIVVERVEGNEVFVRQELRHTGGDWFYWAFQVRANEPCQLTFHFTDGDVVGVRGPAVSNDGGESWSWPGNEVVSRSGEGASFSYDFSGESTPVRFALCPTYTQVNLDRFLRQHPIEKSVLCRSRDERDVELLTLGNADAPLRVFLTSRHHACEAMASYVLEGIFQAVLANDERGAWLRENVVFAAVPFVDKDGVEQGDQGKNRLPHDHNRDYVGDVQESIYPEVRALRGWATDWFASAKIGLLIDLHCPWIRGGRNQEVYFVGNEEPVIWKRVQDFATVLEKGIRGTLPYRAANNLPFGEDWNTASNYIQGRACTQWAVTLPQMHFATSLEIPYADAGGVAVTPQRSRELGEDIAAALREYLPSISAA
jgi:hypothetical protein